MTQNLLVAMDDSENALRAVELVARSFSPDNHVTLLNIMLDTAALCQMNSPGLTPIFRSQQANFCALEDKKRELISAAMQRAKEVLVASGFGQDQITIKVENKIKGVARDLLEEAKKGYDIMVLGRRGMSGIKEFFLGSTSHKVFSGAKEISILIAN